MFFGVIDFFLNTIFTKKLDFDFFVPNLTRYIYSHIHDVNMSLLAKNAPRETV